MPTPLEEKARQLVEAGRKAAQALAGFGLRSQVTLTAAATPEEVQAIAAAAGVEAKSMLLFLDATATKRTRPILIRYATFEHEGISVAAQGERAATLEDLDSGARLHCCTADEVRDALEQAQVRQLIGGAP